MHTHRAHKFVFAMMFSVVPDEEAEVRQVVAAAAGDGSQQPGTPLLSPAAEGAALSQQGLAGGGGGGRARGISKAAPRLPTFSAEVRAAPSAPL